MRLQTRKMWVSTAIVGSPKAVLRMTLAVFLPTPGSASSSSRVCGTSPPYVSRRIAQVSNMFFALALNRPIVRMYSIRPASPRERIWSGVRARLNRTAVAALTETSVACAESTTDTSSSNGVWYLSSVVGFGSSVRNCSKILVRLVLFTLEILD